MCNGFHPRDTLSLPRVDGYEAGLGTIDLTGKRVAVVYDLGSAVVSSKMVEVLDDLVQFVIADARLRQVDVVVAFPQGGLEWAMSNLVGLIGELGDRYPDCADQLTGEIALGMQIAQGFTVQAAGRTEMFRAAFNEQIADLF